MKELCCHVIICHQGTGSQPASRQQLFRLSDNRQTKKKNKRKALSIYYHFPSREGIINTHNLYQQHSFDSHS